MERRLNGHTQRGHVVPPHAYEYYLRGELALTHGEPRRAAEAFELAVSQQSRRSDAYVLSRLALAQARAGAHDLAARTLDEAQRLSPCTAEVWVVRGDIARESGAAERALGHYRRAVECHPDYPSAQRRLVDTLLQVGARERAAEVLREQRDGRRPGSGPALTQQARRLELEAALAREDREALRRALPPDPLRSALPATLCARVLSALDRPREAVVAWSRAAPLPHSLLPDAARDFARAGYWSEAAAAADAALGTPLDAVDEQAMREVLASAHHAHGATGRGLKALPTGARKPLSRWLEEAGAPGLARELAAPHPE